MAITPYCSKDEWSYKKARSTWDDYTGSPVMSTHAYPSSEGLDDMLEEMTALINTEMGRADDDNLGTHLIYLRNLYFIYSKRLSQQLSRCKQSRPTQ